MVVNEDKMKVMLFNSSKMFDFQPLIEISEGKLVDVIEETKLLGLMVRSGLKWSNNTQYIIKKMLHKNFYADKSKTYGANVYFEHIRTLSELSCPMWNSSLLKLKFQILKGYRKLSF